MKKAFRRNIGGGMITASILAMSFAMAPAHAQEAPTANAGKSADDIVVSASRAITATKTDTPLIQIPQSISIVTSQQIRDQGALTMLQALNYTAGVTNIGDDTRNDYSTIRGFGAVIFQDGLKRNFGYVYIPRVDVYGLDRIDVLLGPSAVLYGAGSSGGLINMESKRPQFQFGGEATASYGTYDRKQFQFDVTGPISDTIAVRLVGLYRDADMLLKYVPDNRKLVQPSITWKPDDKTSVSLLGYYDHDYTGPVAYMPLAATLYAPEGKRMKRSTLIGEPDFNRGPKDDKAVTLLVDHQFSKAIKFHSSSRYETDHTNYGEIYGSYYNSPLDPFLDADKTTIGRALFAYKAHYRTFDSDNNLEFNFNTGPLEHKVLAGVDYSYFHQLAQQAFGGASSLNIYAPVYGTANVADFLPLTRQVLQDRGFYGQDQIRYGDIVSLVLGVRQDHLDIENTGFPKEIDDATTYRAGLTVNVTKNLAPYVSYSESFQPVSGLNQFNQSYKPLYGKSYEGGAKWQPLRGMQIRAAYYQITERNHLVADPVNPLVQIQGGEAKSKGVEFQLDYRVANNMTVTASASHNSTRNSGQDRQADALPKDTAAIYGTKVIPLRQDVNLRIGGGVRYVGRQIGGDPASLQVVTPSYTLVDALIALDVKKWTLQINAINLLDKYYYSACTQYGGCSNGDARNINAAITYHF